MDSFFRRLILLALLCIAHSAQAQQSAGCTGGFAQYCDTEASADQENAYFAGAVAASHIPYCHSGSGSVVWEANKNMELKEIGGWFVCYKSGETPGNLQQGHIYWTTNSPPGGESTPEQCQALRDSEDYPQETSIVRPYATQCVGGCNFAPSGPSVQTTMGGETYTNAVFRFTGNTCPVVANQPGKETVKTSNLPPQLCKAAGAGQTFCVNNAGEHCYTASTNKQICWGASELGKKYDGPVIQARVAGTTPGTAPTAPGTTVTQTGTPTTATATSASTTVTTTTTNYTTVDGSSPGPSNDAEPATPGDSASGGSCSSSYICSGDSLKCASLEEQRKTRCAVEHGNEGITGGATCTSGDAPVCTGTGCNAAAYSVVLQQYKSRCAAETLGAKVDTSNAKLDAIKTAIEGIDGGSPGGVLGGTVDDPGDDDAAQGEAGTAAGNGHGQQVEYGQDGLNQDGMGFDRSCPDLSFDFNGAHYAPDMFWICTGAEIESYIFLLIVAVFCLRYIGGP